MRLWSTSASRVDPLGVAVSYHPTITRRWNPPPFRRIQLRTHVHIVVPGCFTWHVAGRISIHRFSVGAWLRDERGRLNPLDRLSFLIALTRTIVPRYVRVTLAKARKQSFKKKKKKKRNVGESVEINRNLIPRCRDVARDLIFDIGNFRHYCRHYMFFLLYFT